jgi:tocopherol O-methyltransferase
VHILSRPNDKVRIAEHYDVVSPYYQALWGKHIHHGYWITGEESKDVAQIQLIEHLAELADIKYGADILDIGCGMGATSLYLAEKYHASAVGITVSQVQIEMANKSAAGTGLDVTFLLMDADEMRFEDRQFDLLWSVESISHYHDLPKFFSSAAKLLKPGGTFALIDWFRKEYLTPAETRKFVEPIERGMFVELKAMADYQKLLNANRLELTHRQVLNKNCAKTWDISAEIIRHKSFWDLALLHGPQFINYLKAFQAMRAGFASGNFVYGLLVAKAPILSSPQ